MMKAAEPGTGDHRRSRRRPNLHGPSIRRVLIEGIVNPVVVMVVYVIVNESSEMLFVQRDAWSRISRRQLPTQRSAVPFCQGACTLVRLGSTPVAFKKAITSASNFESWSKMA